MGTDENFKFLRWSQFVTTACFSSFVNRNQCIVYFKFAVPCDSVPPHDISIKTAKIQFPLGDSV
jgi:hypothetical protein